MELKEKLASLRRAKGLSQSELAEEMCVTRQAVSRWEVGTAIPTTDNLIWLSRFYQISLDELVNDAVQNETVLCEDKKPNAIPPQIVISGKTALFVCAAIAVMAIAINIAIWMFVFHAQTHAENKNAINLTDMDCIDLNSLDGIEFEYGDLESLDNMERPRNIVDKDFEEDKR